MLFNNPCKCGHDASAHSLFNVNAPARCCFVAGPKSRCPCVMFIPMDHGRLELMYRAALEEIASLRRYALVERDAWMRMVRDLCRCSEPDRSPPTDWKSKARIPHHTDCAMYLFELPDPAVAPAAYADAMKRRDKLLEGT